MTAYGKYYVNYRDLHHGQHLSRGLGKELVNMLEAKVMSSPKGVVWVYQIENMQAQINYPQPLIRFGQYGTILTSVGVLKAVVDFDWKEILFQREFVSGGATRRAVQVNQDSIGGKDLGAGETQKLEIEGGFIVIASMRLEEIQEYMKRVN